MLAGTINGKRSRVDSVSWSYVIVEIAVEGKTAPILGEETATETKQYPSEWKLIA